MSWQRDHIGRDLIAASEELAEAKRLGNVGGPLATQISDDMQAAARRKVKNLAALAEKYAPAHLSRNKK